MTRTTTIRRFPYVALVRVPLVVDALLLLILLAPVAMPRLLVFVVVAAVLYTLPLGLTAALWATAVLRYDAARRTRRHVLAIVCGIAQAALVLTLLSLYPLD